jgi:ankyrin repeat protein
VNADVDSITLTKKTKAGRLPLHMAIEQKLPTDVIKLLLGEDLKSSFHAHDAIEVSYKDAGRYNRKDAITTPFNGMIPLQIACWNSSSLDTIKALLDADESNVTIDMEVGKESPILKNPDCLDDEDRESSRLLQASYSLSKSFSMSRDEEEPSLLVAKSASGRAPVEARCDLPLHLAAQHGSTSVMSLLLEKEKEKTRNQGDEDNVMFQDHLGRTPLHIILRNSIDPSIISALLDFDENGETTQITDDYGFMPIHYACERKDASEEIVKLLIEAEDRYIAFKTHNDKNHKVKRSTHICEDRKRSPLYLAVKAGAPESVIEKLLEPDQFYLKGFDNALVAGLSSMAVKNRLIQSHIIEKLSERCYFNLLFTDIYANACALALFLAASENLIAGEITVLKPLMIWACMVVFVLRELIQIKSQGSKSVNLMFSLHYSTNY